MFYIPVILIFRSHFISLLKFTRDIEGCYRRRFDNDSNIITLRSFKRIRYLFDRFEIRLTRFRDASGDCWNDPKRFETTRFAVEQVSIQDFRLGVLRHPNPFATSYLTFQPLHGR